MGKQLASLNTLTLINLDSGPGRQIMNVEYLAILVFDNDLRMFIAFMLDYDRSANLAFSLFLNSNRFAFNNINKTYKPGHLCQNWCTVRVPFEQRRPDFNFLAVIH